MDTVDKIIEMVLDGRLALVAIFLFGAVCVAVGEAIGQRLKFTETAIVGAEYTPDGVLFGSNRPHKTGHAREFYAQVIMKSGLIFKVK